MIDERTEILINRRLDGELTPEESLELDKRLIRSPEARRMLEEYAVQDELAGTTLRSLLAAPPERRMPDVTTSGSWFSRLGRHVAASVSVAASIGIILLVVNGSQNPAIPAPDGGRAGSRPNAEPSVVTGIVPASSSQLADFVPGPRRERESIISDVLAVMDPETRSIYLLQMDKQQTTVVPDVADY